MKFLNRFKRKSQADPESDSAKSPVSPTEPQGNVANGASVAPKPPSADEISLKLGDFLHRIPAHLLQAGPHDLQKEIRFSINLLSDRINRGETTINLAEIYRQMPEIFRSEVREADKQQVLYPWRKVITMIKDARGDLGGKAAENLAEKIRQKKPAARGTNAATGAQAPSKSAQTPILRGRGRQQASWFSRTTLDKPGEGAPQGPSSPPAPTTAAEIPEARVEAPAPANSPIIPTTTPALAESAENTLKLVSRDEPLGAGSINLPPAPATIAATPASDPVAGSKPGPAPLSKPATDALNLSDMPVDLQRRVAVIKGEYERQLSELEVARKTFAQEVERLQKELSQTADRLDEEKTANSATRDMLQQASRDREATQQQIAELQAKLQNLQKDDRLTAMTAERDALLQQKAHLSKQISELSKRGASPIQRNGDNAAASAVLQRQVEEFQRRITLMESAQRDTALELAREKEARAKAEKLLSAAEKLQEQSANYMESAKAEIRKEIEASVKPREIEARKLQKELQEQIAQMSDQNRKLATELENARTALANAAANPAVPAQDDFQTRAITQLEADVENYRERLKSLLKERDTARAEAKELGARVTSSQSAEGLAAERARLELELEKARKEHSEQATALEALRRERATAEERLAAERNAFETRFDSLRQSLHAAEGALERKAQQRADGGAPTESEAIAQLRKEAAEAVAAAKAAADELAESKRRFEELSEKHAKLGAELISARSSMEAERDTSATRLRDQSHSLEQQLNKVIGERENLARDHAALMARAEKDRAASDDLLANLERDHTTVVRSKEDLAQRLAESERNLEAANLVREKLSRSADGFLGEAPLIGQLVELRGKVAELEKARAEQVAGTSQERRDYESVKMERDQLAAKVSSLEKLHEETFARHTSELNSVRHAGQELTAALELAQREAIQAREGGGKVAATVAHLEEELSAVRKSAEARQATLSKELDAAVKKRDLLAATLDEEQKKAAGSISRLETELGTARKDCTASNDRIGELTKELDAGRQKNHQLSLSLDQERQKVIELDQKLQKHTEDAARLGKELAGARAEIAGFVEKTRLSAEDLETHKKLLEEANTALGHAQSALAQEREKFAREQAEMESRVAASAQTATQVVEQSAAELAEARASYEALQQSMAEVEGRAGDLARQLSDAQIAQQRAASRITELEASATRSAEQIEATLRQVAAARDEGEAALVAAGRRHEEQASRARQEIAALQTERDNLSQQRDELLRRLNRITEEHKRLLDDLTAEPRVVPPPASAGEDFQPTNVIEVSMPEVLPPDQASNGIAIPRIRPMAVPPPRISTL